MTNRSIAAALPWLLLACAAAWPAAARDVEGLYSARVTVADRSPAELARGARAALSAVLVKLTGNARAAAGPAAGVLDQAQRLLLGYTYENGGEDDDALTLVAEFDEPALLDALAARSVPVWGKERPDTLLWLVIDEQGTRRMPSSDEPGPRGEAALARAAQRGIPVLLPLMDIEETRHLTYAGDWDGIAATALALSGRYATPATLVGYLSESARGIWEARWKLQVGTESYDWRQEGDLAALLLDEGIDSLADALARRFADPGMLARADTLTVDVVGLESARDYARVVNYLGGLDTVSRLFVRSLEAGRLEVEVRARGGRATLAQSIAFGEVLAPLEDRADTYRLLR